MRTLAAYGVEIFGIDLNFDSIAFTLPIGDGWSIYWYGVCIALAFLLAVVYGFFRAKKFGIDPDRLTDVVLVTTPIAIICARIYYIIFYPGELNIDSVGDFFGISGGSGMAGLAIYGGIIGAAVIGPLMCKLRKVNMLDALDLAAISFLIGQAIGRWGNFFNQEAFGSLTKGPGMMSNGVLDYIIQNPDKFGLDNMTSTEITKHITENGLAVHPTFLYESLWCILGFVLLHFLSKHRKFKGQIALSYGVWYGFGRMIIEGLRTDSLYLGPLKVSQWVSGALMLVCGILLIVFFIRLKNAKEALTYETMFDDIDDSTVKTVSYYEGDEEDDGISEDDVTDKEEVSDKEVSDEDGPDDENDKKEEE